MADPVTRALAEVARLGPFFAVATDPAEEADPTWRRLDALDTGDLARLIAAYARRLGGVEDRVAASILFQALASRLWSPVVACAAGYGVVPDLAGLHWRWAPGAPIALWLADPGGENTAEPAAVHAAVVDGGLRPLRETFGAVVKLADGLLWGNAASALVGTLRAGSLRPELAVPVTGLVRALLTMEPLAGTGTFTNPLPGTPAPTPPASTELGTGTSTGPLGDTGGAAGSSPEQVLRPEMFRRRSCCLYYRVPPGGGMCGDCALLPQA
ncbi:(2Fe-2S)-binding protein [Actinomadura scrupuli]|uniref:(2Fe-2S)-binding protein n=1 Tax=Actinomadura scrupuli TaxID=559629 RepID=UPI003D98B11A